MRILSHVVPLLVGVLFSGCYIDHGLEPGPIDAGPLDDAAPTPLDAGRRVDAGPLDSGPITTDAGLVCPLARASWACFESFAAPPGRRFELPLTVDACECCPMSECAITVDAAARTIRATTTLCPGLCDCVACNPAVARCQVPALTAGEWIVEVNGAVAMTLPVNDEPGLLPPPPACIDFAEPDACTGTGVLEGRPQPASRACVRPAPSGAQQLVAITDDCGSCDREGPCVVTAERRITDDLPPGMDIRVNATRFFGACDSACPPVCIETTRECLLPVLPLGEVHRVYVGGLAPILFESETTSEVCTGG